MMVVALLYNTMLYCTARCYEYLPVTRVGDDQYIPTETITCELPTQLPVQSVP